MSTYLILIWVKGGCQLIIYFQPKCYTCIFKSLILKICSNLYFGRLPFYIHIFIKQHLAGRLKINPFTVLSDQQIFYPWRNNGIEFEIQTKYMHQLIEYLKNLVNMNVNWKNSRASFTLLECKWHEIFYCCIWKSCENQEDCCLPFFNIFASSRVITSEKC